VEARGAAGVMRDGGGVRGGHAGLLIERGGDGFVGTRS